MKGDLDLYQLMIETDRLNTEPIETNEISHIYDESNNAF